MTYCKDCNASLHCAQCEPGDLATSRNRCDKHEGWRTFCYDCVIEHRGPERAAVLGELLAVVLRFEDRPRAMGLVRSWIEEEIKTRPVEPAECPTCGDTTVVRSFEIWSEGFAATGERATATFHGTARGATFEEACAAHFAVHGETNAGGDPFYNEERNTYFTKLHDNAVDARRAFG